MGPRPEATGSPLVTEQLPTDIQPGLSRRGFIRGLAVAGAAAALGPVIASCSSPNTSSAQPNHNHNTGNTAENGNSPELEPNEEFLLQTAESLLNSRDETPLGWRFQSKVQYPHYQVDRDVGAASVGMGFLAMVNKYPDDPKWLDAAKNTAKWLINVSSEDGPGTRYWYDYIDDNEVSSDYYTSFDDGAIGIGDFFWQLSEATSDDDPDKAKYQQVAIETVIWTMGEAENLGTETEPEYRWRWDLGDHSQPYYIGMGEGVIGIVNTLATYYERLADSRPDIAKLCKQYIDGGLRYLDRARTELVGQTGDSTDIQALPYSDPNAAQDQTQGNTEMDSGYLSGAAGGAFAYLHLYEVFNDDQYLAKAEELLGWLSTPARSDKNPVNGPLVNISEDQVAWKLSLDPQGGDNDAYATGIEEGNAGIGWTFMQAYLVTGNQDYLDMAKKAANYLHAVAGNDGKGGLYWHEDEHPTNRLVHFNLDNGNAGIGLFLKDLAIVTAEDLYAQDAQGALNFIRNGAKGRGDNIYWNDNGGNDPYSDDPSWHWGKAGIVEFAQRMVGGSMDIPGEEPSLAAKARLTSLRRSRAPYRMSTPAVRAA